MFDENVKKTVKQILEAKKKKEKAEELKHCAKPSAYGYAEAFDFSAPLGQYNLYGSQGHVNWGPMTGPGTKIDDRIAGQRATLEQVTSDMMKEATAKSEWAMLREAVEGPEQEYESDLDEASPWGFLKGAFGGKGGVKDKAAGAAKGVAGAAKRAADKVSNVAGAAAKKVAEPAKQIWDAGVEGSKESDNKKTVANVKKSIPKVNQELEKLTSDLEKVMAVIDQPDQLQSINNATDSVDDTISKLGNVVMNLDLEKGQKMTKQDVQDPALYSRGKSRIPGAGAGKTGGGVPHMTVKAR